jgi:hypothetical protein
MGRNLEAIIIEKLFLQVEGTLSIPLKIDERRAMSIAPSLWVYLDIGTIFTLDDVVLIGFFIIRLFFIIFSVA